MGVPHLRVLLRSGVAASAVEDHAQYIDSVLVLQRLAGKSQTADVLDSAFCEHRVLRLGGYAETLASPRPILERGQSVSHARPHRLRLPIRDVLAGNRLDDIDNATIMSLPFLLGSTAPVLVRSAVGDAVFRYYNDCSSP
jgi:hypothetical protein